MKVILLCLLSLTFAACNPMGKYGDDDDDAAAQAKAKAVTPTPVPQPGDWMQKKHIGNGLGGSRDPLGVKNGALDATPRRK